MNRPVAPASVAAPLGPYSHGVASTGSGTWLHIAGQVGVDASSTLQGGFEAQARQAWSNLVAVLVEADMDVSHLVKVTSYLVAPGDAPKLGPVRAAFLGAARPASTLVVVAALARPEWLFEVDAVAFRPA
jgi:enamine deaminase RidA (YjgF/YER057c/UK114 family)